MDGMKEQLREKLRDKEYREQYADSALVNDISSQVQALRRQRGLSQEDLARRVGTKQPTISNIEMPRGGNLPNWEITTLNRIAHALGIRLKIKFETYGSLLDELDEVTTESLRRPSAQDDRQIFPPPPKPGPDAAAPERTRWMQEVMIPWLWEDRLDMPRLVGWLRGRGLPPVGHEEEPYHWLLRGIAVEGSARDHLEMRLAERLAIVLGEQPDVSPFDPDDPDEFLLNLYWTCAGLERPGFLAEQLWRAYARLRGSKLSGAVRDALQAAVMHNQFGETKPLKIWAAMVEQGRHSWFRGDEVTGFKAILIRHRTVKADLETVFWALGKISKLWKDSSIDKESRFMKLIELIPDLSSPEKVNQMSDYASAQGSDWEEWAKELVTVKEEKALQATAGAGGDSGHLTLKLRLGELALRAEWRQGQIATGNLRFGNNELPLFEDQGIVSQQPNMIVFLNAVATDLGNAQEDRPEIEFSAKMLHAKTLRMVRETRQQVQLNC
jgi:transcriptional regulator with XRE-family HTH domain